MDTPALLVLIAGTVLIFGVVWYFFGAKPKVRVDEPQRIARKKVRTSAGKFDHHGGGS